MRHIRRDDTVAVITGKDKGKTGKVIRFDTEKNRVLIQGVNFVTRHVRRRKENEPWGRLKKESFVHVSNVKLVCAKCNKPTKTQIQTNRDLVKVRVCKGCKEEI
ncbi:MAG: 50S ribosomal protein L24 [Candidatus Omnitrophota bacterium]